MALYKTKNPTLNLDAFTKDVWSEKEEIMSFQGTVTKTIILGLTVFLSAMFTWWLYATTYDFAAIQPYVIGGLIAGFIIGLIITFKKKTAPYLAPVYCIMEGLALGGISAFMEQIFTGIVLQAIVLTLGILLSLIVIYKLEIIKATENFKLIVSSATAGIAFYYLLSFVGQWAGFQLPLIHESSTGGIIFSLVIVVIAALNLVMDFDMIEQGVKAKAPKYMEWYGAFGIMVTLIWLYIEILRLLAKLRSRD